jgi:hypothetical protein
MPVSLRLAPITTPHAGACKHLNTRLRGMPHLPPPVVANFQTSWGARFHFREKVPVKTKTCKNPIAGTEPAEKQQKAGNTIKIHYGGETECSS